MMLVESLLLLNIDEVIEQNIKPEALLLLVNELIGQQRTGAVVELLSSLRKIN